MIDAVASADAGITARVRAHGGGLLIAVSLIFATAASPAAAAGLPPDFVGVYAPDVFVKGSAYRNNSLQAQRHAGVSIVRQVFDWAQIETKPGTYHFRAYDAYVLDLARHGVDVLPIVIDAPRFRTAHRSADVLYPPTDLKSIRPVARALAARYGANGTLWRDHPEVQSRPVRNWQVWNEPDLTQFWGYHPNARQYTKLYLAARAGLLAGDSSAQVVSAGIAFAGYKSKLQSFITKMMDAGMRNHVDALAINAYAAGFDGILAELQFARQVLDQAGATNLPLWMTEFGWADAGPPSPFNVGVSQQAKNVGKTIKTLAARRCDLQLLGVVYYEWRDEGKFPSGADNWTRHAGLLRLSGTPKPSLKAFKKAASAARKTNC